MVHLRLVLAAVALAAAMAALPAAGGALAQETGPDMASDAEAPIGMGEYLSACASCHGADGTGDGPMASQLVTPPADLTGLASRNGGAFPIRRVFEIIDGRAEVAAHGSREMPVWGSRYLAEADGMLGPYGDEAAVTARLLLLTFYLQNIQQQADAEAQP